MARELIAIDISDRPELLSLAEEVRSSRAPRLLTHGDQELAILMPVESGPATQKGSSVAEATFGAVTPKKRPEDLKRLRREFEEEAAAEVIAETDRP